MDFKKLNFDKYDNIFIYGFGISGKWFVNNSPKKIKAFIDTDEKKSGMLHSGIKVLKISEAKQIIKKNDLIFVSVVDIQDIIPAIKRNFKSVNWLAMGLYLDGNDASGTINKTEETIDFINYSLNAVEKCQKAYVNKDELFLRSVDIVISEKCSLKCKDCSNLMQYYLHPRNFSSKTIVDEFEKLTSKVKHIFEVRLIGGEPFMNKEIYEIIDYFCNHKKITKLVIYSNGTIPLKEDRLKNYQNSKLVFAITDYDKLSKNTDRVHQSLIKLNIPTRRHPPEYWTDSGTIQNFNRSEDGMKEIFDLCCGKNLLTSMNDKLYRCPFAANADSLKGIPYDKSNYVNLDSDPKVIHKYIREIDYIPACNYCKGRSFDSQEIVPAIQTKNPIQYKKFE